MNVRDGRAGTLRHQLLHDAVSPARLPPIGKNQPEKIQHPVGWRRITVAVEGDAGNEWLDELRLLHRVSLLDRHSWHTCSAPDDRHDASSFLRIHRRWH